VDFVFGAGYASGRRRFEFHALPAMQPTMMPSAQMTDFSIDRQPCG
jgi:hypothetical protein